VVIPLDEPLIEPAMAVMSCGPAFLAAVLEALVEAGTAHGLPGDDATLMAVETMAGTAAYVSEHDLDAAGLRARVATPGGVTERGLDALLERGMPEAFRAAVDSVVEAAAR
jgi:pyrroline-5-carboxylate reductase